ncbi:hypothetical protein Scep_010158 [Stephania cephalantha]|uniref:Uncharacterized protein n=1 Tax=Stephania cephalantha TaxID=152367 RepID=A0AAP0JWZ2_9MAGN
MCENFVVEISGHEMVIDLRVLELLEFDVLLRMDWLVVYQAQLDCFQKTIFFYIMGCTMLTFIRTLCKLPLTRGRLATGK